VAKKILHIATDEKFISTAEMIYEKAFPGNNKFIILTEGKNKNTKYVEKNNRYLLFIARNKSIKAILSEIEKSKIIVFHGINYFQSIILNCIKQSNDKTIIWSAYGMEVYNNKLIVENNLGPLTKNLVAKNLKEIIKIKFKSTYYKLIFNTNTPDNLIKNSLKNVTIVAVLFEEEFKYYQSLNIINENCSFMKFTYYPIDIVIPKKNDYITGNNVLIGNSALPSNNHLESFLKLKDFPEMKENIICPLNYGKKWYAKKIVKIGKSYFGERFQPILEFLKLKDYQVILNNCSIVIMNQQRQQAVGNVLNCLYNGSKVYLNEKNTLLHYLKRINCKVYDFDRDLHIGNPTSLEKLSIDEMKLNRSIIEKELDLNHLTIKLREKIVPIINT
jgi:hypothetical protein